MSSLGESITEVYDRGSEPELSDLIETFLARHGVESLLILTVEDKHTAVQEARSLFYEIAGKRVVEIGAGVGLLSIEMAKVAKTVISIEADPAWAWVFTKHLYRVKSPNLTWVFGTAESVSEWVRGDVAVIYTRSGALAMVQGAMRMCPKIVFGPRVDHSEKNLQRIVRALRPPREKA